MSSKASQASKYATDGFSSIGLSVEMVAGNPSQTSKAQKTSYQARVERADLTAFINSGLLAQKETAKEQRAKLFKEEATHRRAISSIAAGRSGNPTVPIHTHPIHTKTDHSTFEKAHWRKPCIHSGVNLTRRVSPERVRGTQQVPATSLPGGISISRPSGPSSYSASSVSLAPKAPDALPNSGLPFSRPCTPVDAAAGSSNASKET